MGAKISKSKETFTQGNADHKDDDTPVYSTIPSANGTATNSCIRRTGKAEDREDDTLGYSRLPSGRSTATNSYITPITDGVQDKRDSRRDTKKERASNERLFSGPRYNTKTGTFTGQRHNGRHRKRLDSVFCDKTAVSQDTEIESMVKKYWTKIVKDVVVGHILSLMKTFIDRDEIDEIAEKDGSAAAMEALLHKIQNCRKRGRWQRFVEALSANGYGYICDLLQGGSKKKGISVQQKLLRILTPGIINRINPVELARYLFSHSGINDYDLETIEQEERLKGKRSAAYKLLKVVPCRSANWVQLLCDAMKAEGHYDLAEQLLDHYVEVSSNTEGPHTSSNSEFENTSEPSTPDSGLQKDSRSQIHKRRPKRRSNRQHIKSSRVTSKNAEEGKLKDEIDSLRRKSFLIEEKEDILEELQRKEDELKKKYGERPDFGLDVSELRRKMIVLEGKELLMQELAKKENDFKSKFGKGIENTEDNTELVKRLTSLQTKILLTEQIENNGEKLSHLEAGKKQHRKEKKKKKKLRSSDKYGTSSSSIPDEVETNDLLSEIESMISTQVQRRFTNRFLEYDYHGMERDFKLPRPHYTSDYYSFSS
ncbi:hypothetical protein CHS0354_014876 [Potamilus streckersoni]|uniref:Caspase recruitment domain-containing protein n=1 Tax=Potamilus streckersoni TaxID=2493646 RepID=A0AAE0WED5_9BIVA|nr:hypothetical protein CHS0354_014876 [Potamilus streckersoni]